MKAKRVVACSPPKEKKIRVSLMGYPKLRFTFPLWKITNAPNLITGYKTGKGRGFEWEITYSRQRPSRPLHEHVLITHETV